MISFILNGYGRILTYENFPIGDVNLTWASGLGFFFKCAGMLSSIVLRPLVSSHARSWVDPLMLDAVGPLLKSQLVLKS